MRFCCAAQEYPSLACLKLNSSDSVFKLNFKYNEKRGSAGFQPPGTVRIDWKEKTTYNLEQVV